MDYAGLAAGHICFIGSRGLGTIVPATLRLVLPQGHSQRVGDSQQVRSSGSGSVSLQMEEINEHSTHNLRYFGGGSDLDLRRAELETIQMPKTGTYCGDDDDDAACWAGPFSRSGCARDVVDLCTCSIGS